MTTATLSSVLLKTCKLFALLFLQNEKVERKNEMNEQPKMT